MNYRSPYNVTHIPYESGERVIPFLTGVALGNVIPGRFYYPPFPTFYPYPVTYPFFPFQRFRRRRRRFYW